MGTMVDWYAQDLIDAVNGDELLDMNVSQIAMWHVGANSRYMLPFIMIWRAAKRWVRVYRERLVRRVRVIRNSLLYAPGTAWGRRSRFTIKRKRHNI